MLVIFDNHDHQKQYFSCMQKTKSVFLLKHRKRKSMYTKCAFSIHHIDGIYRSMDISVLRAKIRGAGRWRRDSREASYDMLHHRTKLRWSKTN